MMNQWEELAVIMTPWDMHEAAEAGDDRYLLSIMVVCKTVSTL